jgi:hypothetical protein
VARLDKVEASAFSNYHPPPAPHSTTRQVRGGVTRLDKVEVVAHAPIPLLFLRVQSTAFDTNSSTTTAPR